MILLHGFIKKSQKAPPKDIEIALKLRRLNEMTSKNKHIGSSCNDFLEEENLLASTEIEAIKRVIAYLLQQQIDNKIMTKTDMAQILGTNRSGLDRLLDPENTSVTLHTLAKAAELTGKKIHITLQ